MYGDEFVSELERLESRFPEQRRRAALLGALHAVQDRVGYVPDEAIHWLAERYGTSAADVLGVISFYTMFFDRNPGKHVIWLCRTFSCQLLGAFDVAKALEEKLGCKMGETDATGDWGLRWMECLAACDAAPCALVDGDMYECLTPDSLDIVLDAVKAGGGGGRIRRRPDGGVELAPLASAGGD